MDIRCICGKEFSADPTAADGYVVACPTCGAKIRVRAGVSGKDYRKGIKAAASEPEQIATKIQRRERLSCVLWIVIAVVQIVTLLGIPAGLWNGINAIVRLRSIKNITPGNPAVVGWYDERKAWLIVFAVVNLVIGGVVGVFLVAHDWSLRDYVLQHRSVFEGEKTPA